MFENKILNKILIGKLFLKKWEKINLSFFFLNSRSVILAAFKPTKDYIQRTSGCYGYIKTAVTWLSDVNTDLQKTIPERFPNAHTLILGNFRYRENPLNQKI